MTPAAWPPNLSPENSSDQSAYAGPNEATLIELYFANFHPAHPILVPKLVYNAIPIPESLRAVVRYIGSILSTTTTSGHFAKAAAFALEQDQSWSAFRVQALLLFSIALHSMNEQMQAQQYLSKAVDLATVLHMNRYGFAAANSGGQPVLEESLRRTWWELYTIDGLMAANHQRKFFRCSNVELDAGLPCEDPTFLAGQFILPAPRLSQFDNRIFDDTEKAFSSYCYRIEAVRLLARVIAIAENADIDKDEFTAVDNSLAGWRYHLPPCKADITRTEKAADIDELMFQAQLIVHFATILLHLPRSNLRSVHPLTSPMPCCPWSTPLAPTCTTQNHLMKVTAASQGLSDLAALRTSHDHTPLLACGLILGSLVQLSICSLHASNCITQHRERVMLMIGVLKSLGRVWTLANRGLTQLRQYAKEILQRPTACAAPNAQYNTAADFAEAIEAPPATRNGNPNGDSTHIDISWMDDLLQPLPPMQYWPVGPPPPHPAPHSAFGGETYYGM